MYPQGVDRTEGRGSNRKLTSATAGRYFRFGSRPLFSLLLLASGLTFAVLSLANGRLSWNAAGVGGVVGGKTPEERLAREVLLTSDLIGAGAQVRSPLLTLFTTFKKRRDRWRIHWNVINNWALLQPHVRAVLFDDHTDRSLVEFALKLNWTVLPVPAKNIYGTPLLKELFFACQQHVPNSVFYGYANGDILFDEGLSDTLRQVTAHLEFLHKSLVVGRRTNFKVHGRRVTSLRQVRALAEAEGRLFRSDAEDYFLLAHNDFPWRAVPGIVIGRPAYDNFLVATAKKQGVAVVDATRTLVALHQTGVDGDFAGHRNRDANYNTRIIGRFDYSEGLTSGSQYVTKYGTDGRVQLWRRQGLNAAETLLTPVGHTTTASMRSQDRAILLNPSTSSHRFPVTIRNTSRLAGGNLSLKHLNLSSTHGANVAGISETDNASQLSYAGVSGPQGHSVQALSAHEAGDKHISMNQGDSWKYSNILMEQLRKEERSHHLRVSEQLNISIRERISAHSDLEEKNKSSYLITHGTDQKNVSDASRNTNATTSHTAGNENRSQAASNGSANHKTALPSGQDDMDSGTSKEDDATNCSCYGRLTLFTTFDTRNNFQHEFRLNVLQNWMSLPGNHVTAVLFSDGRNAIIEVAAAAANWTVLPLPRHSGSVLPLKQMFTQVQRVIPDSRFYGYLSGELLFGPSLLRSAHAVEQVLGAQIDKALLVGVRLQHIMPDGEQLSKPDEVDKVIRTETAARPGSSGTGFEETFLLADHLFPWQHIPDLVIGRAMYNNYLIALALRHEFAVVDATKTLAGLQQTTNSPNVALSGDLEDFDPNLLGALDYTKGYASSAQYETTMAEDGSIKVWRRGEKGNTLVTGDDAPQDHT